MKNYYILVIISLMAAAGCKKKAAPDLQLDYFPIKEGHYIIYDAVEITHDAKVNKHDTLIFQLKTRWGKVYQDNENRTCREFLRYKRISATDSWQLTDKWHGLIDGTRAEIVEENRRNIEMVFAPTYDKIWDYNAFNPQNENRCYYRAIYKDTVISGHTFNSAIFVEREDKEPSLIDSVKIYTVFAEGIGMVYKHYKNNHHQFDSIPGPVGNYVKPEVDEGREVYYRFVSAGID